MVSAGSYGIGTLNKSNGTLTNKSTLTVSNFNQSNGTTTNSGNLTIGNANLGGTLNSTGTLNLTGNVVTRGNLTSTGNLNNRAIGQKPIVIQLQPTLTIPVALIFRTDSSSAMDA